MFPAFIRPVKMLLVRVIDPQQGNARVITPEQLAGVIMGEEATLSGEPVLPGWSIQLSALLHAGG